jgi:peptidoglycan/xylan/chitin deacetylase (PgdA/CDA1 family)/SAM-dependent methyltransferase
MFELARPRTSVIVPARNAAQTVRCSLDCLINQTDTNWEAIVLDDQSNDETASIIANYVARDRRIRFFKGPGHGVAAARNAGLSEANGKRILFLDADDWVDPDFLERMNEALDGRASAVAAYCAYRRFTPDGRLTPARSDPGVAKAPLERFARTCAAAIHTVLADHAFVKRVGGFDTSLRTCEDWDFWQRLARLGGEWVHVDRAMSYYRTSPNSLSQNISQMKADARVVIARGFSADTRVSGVPIDLAKGAAPDDNYGPEQSYGYFGLWCSALDIGRRRPVSLDADILRGLTPASSRAADIANVVLDGILVGLQTDIEGMSDTWPSYAPGVRELFDLIAAKDPAPGARRQLQYAFEILLLKYSELTEPREFDFTLGLQVDLRDPKSTSASPGIDRLHVRLCAGARILKVLDLGIVSPMTPQDWRDIAAREIRDRDLLRIATPASLGTLIKRRILDAAQRVSNRSGRGGRQISRLREWSEKPRRGSHNEKIRALCAAASATAPLDADPIPSCRPPRRSEEGARGSDRHAFFENIFQEPNPWDYGSPYEQEKYRFQLELLPEGELGSGMELACAEGMFTEIAAPRFRSFLAADIAETALARAQARCSHLKQVSFQVLDLATAPLPTDLDVIFCSEVLYYLRDVEELAYVAKRLAASLRPGGIIISAHAFLLKETPDRTAFDWENPFGAQTISETFSATEALALERAIETELYRIDRFRRIETGESRPVPRIERRAVAAKLEANVARYLIRGGVKARRAEVAYAERPTEIPVLMYHSVGDSGPTALARYRTTPEAFDAQMHWLRQNGYHSIGSEELLWFIANRHPFYGRPVMITFDDALQDFADAAWPILRSHDFTAEVFAVTDLVGQTAHWDAAYGPAARLMDAETITRLHAEGVRFGSHLATHSGADGLSTLDLIDELVRSRAALSRWLRSPVQSMAAPYGLSDDRLRRLAHEAGYRACFGTRDGLASLWDDPFNIPRVEVQGRWSLDEFRRALGRPK